MADSVDWKGMAKALGAQGRGGDTDLVHVNPREKMILALFGGSGTKNPKTGLTEYMEDTRGGGSDGTGVGGDSSSSSSSGLASQGALDAIGAAGAQVGGSLAGSIGGAAGPQGDISAGFEGLQGLSGDSLSGRAQGPGTMDVVKGLASLAMGFNPVTSMVGGLPGLISKDLSHPGTQPSSWDVMSAVMGPMAVGAYGLNALMEALGIPSQGVGSPGSTSAVGDMNYLDLLRQSTSAPSGASSNG